MNERLDLAALAAVARTLGMSSDALLEGVLAPGDLARFESLSPGVREKVVQLGRALKDRDDQA